jgi:hydroxymethylglutaryl-CoA lyase
MNLPKNVFIRELGLREGLQIFPRIIPTAEKLKIAELLMQTGVPEIEVTAFVRPDRVPQMADARELALQLPGVHVGSGDVRFTALYLNSKGFIQAEAIKTISNKAWLYSAASEAFFVKNNNLTVESALAGLPDWLSLFEQYNKQLHGLMISTAFGYSEEGIIEPAAFMRLLERYMSALEDSSHSLRELSIADTTGYANPVSVKRLVAMVQDAHPQLEISLHLHDTRGLGIANVVAGLESGVRIFESSLGGVGGCPFAKGAAGNVCTEEIVLLCRELGIETGINLEAYCNASMELEKLMGLALPGKVHRHWTPAVT